MRNLGLGSFSTRTNNRLGTLFYVLVAVLATAPAWIVRYPPLEDLPFHESTLRVIHSYADRNYGFADDFVLSLRNTQYVLYYVVASVLSYVLGVRVATIAMMCLYLGGTSLALRQLLIALGKDERLCLLVVPLLVNQMFMFGLLPFVVGIPLMFLALAVALPYLDRPTWRRGIVLAALVFALFYTHVLPYALFGIGFAALFPWTRPHTWIAVAAPIAPSLAAVGWWISLSKVGKESFGALGTATATVAPWGAALAAWPRWSSDVFHDQSNDMYFIALFVLVLLAIGLAQGDVDRSDPKARALVAVPLACTVAYFVTGQSLGGVWLFSQRFPVLALMMTIPVLRMPTGMRGAIVTTCALMVATLSTVNTCAHFITFQREEVGAFDDALDVMEPRKHVAALMYDKGSAVVNLWPFVHFGSYYQVDKGGVVQFSNAGGFYWWPVQFKPGRYPPPGTRPRFRWEWTPEQVPIGELYPYYDYVLTRGPGFAPPPGTFHVVYCDTHWTVFKRD